MPNDNRQFWVNKQNLSFSKWQSGALSELQPGEVLFAIERFAFTANNITYALLGERFSYWQFFPTPDPEYGIVPVWGVAKVVASKCDDTAVGERFYGYWPLSQYLVSRTKALQTGLLIEKSEHRKALPISYNLYEKITNQTQQEIDLLCLLKPLYTTAYLLALQTCETYMGNNSQILFSSASSKTSLMTAQEIRTRLNPDSEIKLVGLTSNLNKGFVEDTGYYDQVISYDSLSELDKDTGTCCLDFSGNADLAAQLGDLLKHQLSSFVQIGMTDWQALGRVNIAVEPTLFFAPTVYQTVSKQVGAAQLQAAIDTGLLNAFKKMPINIQEYNVTESMDSVYQNTLAGKARADAGQIMVW